MTDGADLGEYATWLASAAADRIRRMIADAPARERIDTKSSSTDLVTAVDRDTEHWLVDQILADRPADAILGEEGGGHDGRSGVRWLLDPIDGTVNFVLGLPDFAVSVAAEQDGTMVAAAVSAPARGELFRATRGGGAWLDGRRLHGPRQVSLERAVIGTGFSYDRQRRHNQGKVAAELLAQIADIRRIGAAALDLCSVAAGRLDGYYEVALHPWDVAAGALIAEEAGALVTGLRGTPPSERAVVAAGPELLPSLVAVLEEFDADRV